MFGESVEGTNQQPPGIDLKVVDRTVERMDEDGLVWLSVGASRSLQEVVDRSLDPSAADLEQIPDGVDVDGIYLLPLFVTLFRSGDSDRGLVVQPAGAPDLAGGPPPPVEPVEVARPIQAPTPSAEKSSGSAVTGPAPAIARA